MLDSIACWILVRHPPVAQHAVKRRCTAALPGNASQSGYASLRALSFQSHFPSASPGRLISLNTCFKASCLSWVSVAACKPDTPPGWAGLTTLDRGTAPPALTTQANPLLPPGQQQVWMSHTASVLRLALSPGEKHSSPTRAMGDRIAGISYSSVLKYATHEGK
jgi:hypothetical protein